MSFPRSADLRTANPVLGKNRLKLGVFGLNSIGCALTLVPEAYQPSWDGSLAVAQAADRAGFEAIVPYARWKSYVPGKPEHRSSLVMECFAWASAIGASTRHSAIFSTCHVPVYHPIVAAKLTATLDHVTGGRAGLNVVAGWHAGEMAMLGRRLGDHDQRYDEADEWMQVVQRCLSSEEAFDFHGEHLAIDEAFCAPPSAQSPWPPIMSAAGSPRGRTFAARHADIAFCMIEHDDDTLPDVVDSYRRLAAAEGREIAVWTPAHVVLADTDAEAEAYLQHYGTAWGDTESADAFIAGQVATGSNLPVDVLTRLRTRIMQGGGGFPLVGTAETVARRLASLSAAGIDGVLLSWVDYLPGVERFAAEVLPLLEERGLRAPHPIPSPVPTPRSANHA